MRRIRKPKVRIEISTDDNTCTLRFEDTRVYTGMELGRKLLIFHTKNSMEHDSSVFRINRAGDPSWDKLVMANDIIRIFMVPNDDDNDNDVRQERLIQVGMCSGVSKVGSYGNDTTQLRITGPSLVKAFMKFGLGSLQEVQAVLHEVGWLYDGDGDNEVKFTGRAAQLVMTGRIRRFIPSMKYNFTEKTYNRIEPYLDLEDLSGWDEFAKLTEVRAFTNFDGTDKQLMDMVTARPFNELFFKNSDKTPGLAKLVIRKTSFNPTERRALEYDQVPTEDFIEEDVGKSDVETYFIFTATPAGMCEELNGDVFSKPQFHPECTDRYGMTKFEVANLYIGTKYGSATEDSETTGGDNASERVTYSKIMADLSNDGRESISKGLDKYSSKISSKYNNITKPEVKSILESGITKGNLSMQDYEKITKNIPSRESVSHTRPKLTKEKFVSIGAEKFNKKETFDDKDLNKKTTKAVTDDITKNYKSGNPRHAKRLLEDYTRFKINPPLATTGDAFDKYLKAIETKSNIATDTISDASESPLVMFSRMLFNWYHGNRDFYAGDFIVLKDPKSNLAKRLIIEDKQPGDTWEFYIDSVEHKFDYDQGYYTTPGVTRGLAYAILTDGKVSPHRFAGFWNQSSDFMGAVMGEDTSKELKEKDVAEKKSSGDKGDSDSGGAQDGGSLDSLKKYNGKLPKLDPSFVQPGNLHPKYQCTYNVYNRRCQLGIPVPLWRNNKLQLNLKRTI
ncbi:tail lysin [Staphylococcus phage vB_SauH_DELF3]|nr:tail lysin [Staphylococcus phage vB_SauH_DELF3]